MDVKKKIAGGVLGEGESAAGRGRNLHGKVTVVVVAQRMKGDANLPQVADAFNALSAGPGSTHRRQEHGREDADNRDDGEHFNQRESGPGKRGFATMKRAISGGIHREFIAM